MGARIAKPKRQSKSTLRCYSSERNSATMLGRVKFFV
jgi:hypothetical protein